jgi:NADH-quinone oxidoreductase subunit B
MPAASRSLLHAFITLQRKIDETTFSGANRPRHLDPDAPSEFPVPEYGAKDLVPTSNPKIWTAPVLVREA